jgi:type VI secretion system FHA domain protein
MKLTLEVTKPKSESDRLGAARRFTFDEEGGTIGRSPDNAWVLKHELVSKVHAEVAFESGVFTIEDLDSSNGTYINGSGPRIESGVRHQLRDGDTLFIDPFTIEARVSTGAAEPRSRDPRVRVPDAPEPVAGRGKGSPFDVLKSRTDWPEDNDTVEPLDEPFAEHIPLPEPNDPSSAGLVVPEDYDPSKSVIRPAVPVPSEPPVRPTPSSSRRTPAASSSAVRSAPAPATHDNLALVLAKAGVAKVEITPELVETLAKVLRTVVDGLMDVFEARQKFKAELDIERTHFRPRQTTPVNNPLKFADSVEDALTKLFVQTPQGYMGPLRAFEDAFADLRNHELAMTAGINAAFAKILEQFDPDDLEKLFDERARASLVPKPGSMRYWDQYRQLLGEMTKEADATSDRLLKDPFASAYKAQLERLRAAKRGAS